MGPTAAIATVRPVELTDRADRSPRTRRAQSGQVTMEWMVVQVTSSLQLPQTGRSSVPIWPTSTKWTAAGTERSWDASSRTREIGRVTVDTHLDARKRAA